MNNILKNEEIRQSVRQQYGRVAESEGAGCGCGPTCCGPSTGIAKIASERIGYSADETGAVPESADMGLGCGNPQAIAALKPGEVVLDLGCGGGFDSFLAARQVGRTGHVIGVDMTPEMVSKARTNAEKGSFHNTEFRLGEIEHVPVADGTVDVIISNCVINLSPDKARVFSEARRVLKPGGRLAISDVVATAEMPAAVRQDMTLYACCVAGAALISEIETILRDCGFINIRITPKDESRSFIRDWTPGMDVTDYVVAATIEAIKPGKSK